jgi:hypothetical protein
MARPRLTDEEREERRRARVRHSFSDAAYTHYNPQAEGYGSTEEWIRAAEAAAAGHGQYKRQDKPKLGSADLRMLGLLDMPSDLAGLKKAFRNAIMIAHPDHGGSTKAAQETLDAYKRLLENF